jgi:hypothetical protein
MPQINGRNAADEFAGIFGKVFNRLQDLETVHCGGETTCFSGLFWRMNGPTSPHYPPSGWLRYEPPPEDL